ncbi:30S ribosomal protein S20 [Candidatus Dependentiae bacterium]|nr:MAG: 30S ribosomal protein S20 [Candidatus Dependentiae bacterium]
MPNIKSAKKRALQTVKRHDRNVARKSDVKTAIKKFLSAVENKELDVAKDLLRQVQAKLSRAQGKGVYHRNTVARKMSRFSKRVKSLTTPA